MNNRGAIWIWAVAFLAIAFLSLAWFCLTWPTSMLIETVEAQYSFPSEATAAITLIKNILAYFLVVMAIGLLLWVAVKSQQREEYQPID